MRNGSRRRFVSAIATLVTATSIAAAAPAFAQDPQRPRSDTAALARLGFIAALYAERDDFRAESEMHAFLQEAPASPLRPEVELARAKLYYRAGRYADADLMLISLLDRNPGGFVAPDARRLLGFSRLRQGRLAEAAPLLNRESALDPVLQPPPYDGARAVAWSTALPGSGFFVLGEPGRAVTALTLNLAFLAGAVIAYEQSNVPAALLFLIVEVAFYSGGRTAVRDEAQRLNERGQQERREAWLRQSSEPRLMATAFEFKF